MNNNHMKDIFLTVMFGALLMLCTCTVVPFSIITVTHYSNKYQEWLENDNR